MVFMKGVSIKLKFEWFLFPNFTIELTVKLLHCDERYDNINFVIRCARYCTCKVYDLSIKWPVWVCSFKRGNRGKVDQNAFSRFGSTHLLVNQRKRNKVLQRRHIQRAIQHTAYSFELENKTWCRTRSSQRILKKNTESLQNELEQSLRR